MRFIPGLSWSPEDEDLGVGAAGVGEDRFEVGDELLGRAEDIAHGAGETGPPDDPEVEARAVRRVDQHAAECGQAREDGVAVGIREEERALLAPRGVGLRAEQREPCLRRLATEGDEQVKHADHLRHAPRHRARTRAHHPERPAPHWLLGRFVEELADQSGGIADRVGEMRVSLGGERLHEDPGEVAIPITRCLATREGGVRRGEVRRNRRAGGGVGATGRDRIAYAR